MKKFLLRMLTVILLIALVGCELSNNPTSKTEEYLSKYQMLDDDINISYTDITGDMDVSAEQQKKYEDLIKKQYQNLSYEIKEEKIDGDEATITTEIQVTDYKKVVDKYNRSAYSSFEYHDLLLEALEQATESITYTIDFKVVKDQYGNWSMKDLGTEDSQKLLGMK